MTKSVKHTSRDEQRSFTRDLGDGVKLDAEVSPCVFMNPSYPLQVTVTLHRHLGKWLGVAYAIDRTKTGGGDTPT
jgi:hypothetical protein